MVFAPLAALAGTALVQAVVTDDWEGVRLQVVQLFGRGQVALAIERRLDETRHQLASASPEDAERVKADVASQWRTRFADLLADHPDAWTELSALVEALKPVIASAANTPHAIPDSAWETATQDFIVGRYDRVQASAQTWLTIMTTLFGVFSAVFVVGGARTISDIQGGPGWRIGMVAAAAAVFLLAFVATMYGLFASWGGLGANLSAPRPPASESAADRRPGPHLWRELKDLAGEMHGMWSPTPVTLCAIEDPNWQSYREYTLDRANLNRKRLHRSRVLGVLAVTFAGALAMTLIFNGVVH